MKISEYIHNVIAPKRGEWFHRNIKSIQYTDDELILLQCPVCGCESKLQIKEIPDGNVSSIDANIICTNCRICTIPRTVDGYYGSTDTINDVINDWNVRKPILKPRF